MYAHHLPYNNPIIFRWWPTRIHELSFRLDSAVLHYRCFEYDYASETAYIVMLDSGLHYVLKDLLRGSMLRDIRAMADNVKNEYPDVCDRLMCVEAVHSNRLNVPGSFYTQVQTSFREFVPGTLPGYMPSLICEVT